LSSSASRKAMRDQINFQREMAQHGIQYRMEDADRAGVHRLAAMGMMPTSSQVIPIVDPLGESVGKMGQDLGNVVSRSKSAEELNYEQAQVALTQAQTKRSEVETQMLEHQLAEAKRAALTPAPLGIMQSEPGAIPGQALMPNADAWKGFFEMKPPPIMSGAGAVQAGKVKGLSVMKLHPDLDMFTFSAEGQESHREVWNEVPTWEKLFMLRYNMEVFGNAWLKDWLRVKAGLEPEGKYDADTVKHPQGRTSTLVQPSIIDKLKEELDAPYESYKQGFRKWFRGGKP